MEPITEQQQLIILPEKERNPLAITELRKNFVFTKKTEGLSERSIAEEWNRAHPEWSVPWTQIAVDVRNVMRELQSSTQLQALEVRELIAARLEKVAEVYYGRMLVREHRATEIYLKVLEKLAALYGANAPAKIAYTDPSGLVGEKQDRPVMGQTELEERLLEILGEAEKRRMESAKQADILIEEFSQ